MTHLGSCLQSGMGLSKSSSKLKILSIFIICYDINSYTINTMLQAAI